jgi:DNA-binding HxlR family transcriptional regulator
LSQNKIIVNCPFRYTLQILQGKWRFAIIYSLLKKGTLRFKELERDIEGITPRMLIKELKELEKEKVVRRKAYATVPPTVEYTLTAYGITLEPIIQSMHHWGLSHIEKIKPSKK